jgi:RNA polymerase sigma factor (sigma-70 family)
VLALQEDLDIDLLAAAQSGDEEAWLRLISRYQPLVDKIIRRHRLSPWDGEDVSQFVWMQLVGQAGRLREPRAVAGWIATTTAHRCCEVLRKQKRSITIDPLDGPGMDSAGSAVVWGSGSEHRGLDDNLLRAELREAVRRGLAELTADQQRLLLLVTAEPAVPYREISRRMGLPVGSIGPTRARLLKRLENALRATAAERPTSGHRDRGLTRQTSPGSLSIKPFRGSRPHRRTSRSP